MALPKVLWSMRQDHHCRRCRQVATRLHVTPLDSSCAVSSESSQASSTAHHKWSGLGNLHARCILCQFCCVGRWKSEAGWCWACPCCRFYQPQGDNLKWVNFTVSVDESGKLVDVEHVMIVYISNHLSSWSFKGSTISSIDHCESNKPDCLSVSPEELCQGAVRDLNYLAVCKGVLADYPQRKGLLHSIPIHAGLAVRVTAAVENCLKASSTDRETAAKQLVTLLS